MTSSQFYHLGQGAQVINSPPPPPSPLGGCRTAMFYLAGVFRTFLTSQKSSGEVFGHPLWGMGRWAPPFMRSSLDHIKRLRWPLRAKRTCVQQLRTDFLYPRQVWRGTESLFIADLSVFLFQYTANAITGKTFQVNTWKRISCFKSVLPALPARPIFKLFTRLLPWSRCYIWLDNNLN